MLLFIWFYEIQKSCSFLLCSHPYRKGIPEQMTCSEASLQPVSECIIEIYLEPHQVAKT